MAMNDEERLRQVLASYGADPARWPAADRRLAGLLDKEVAAEARAVDRLLGLAGEPPVWEGAEARLLARLVVQPAVRPLPRPWATALPIAAALALGIYLGSTGALDPLMPAAIIADAASDDDDLSGAADATDYSAELVS
jgi:hypothetical protein